MGSQHSNHVISNNINTNDANNSSSAKHLNKSKSNSYSTSDNGNFNNDNTGYTCSSDNNTLSRVNSINTIDTIDFDDTKPQNADNYEELDIKQQFIKSYGFNYTLFPKLKYPEIVFPLPNVAHCSTVLNLKHVPLQISKDRKNAINRSDSSKCVVTSKSSSDINNKSNFDNDEQLVSRQLYFAIRRPTKTAAVACSSLPSSGRRSKSNVPNIVATEPYSGVVNAGAISAVNAKSSRIFESIQECVPWYIVKFSKYGLTKNHQHRNLFFYESNQVDCVDKQQLLSDTASMLNPFVLPIINRNNNKNYSQIPFYSQMKQPLQPSSGIRYICTPRIINRQVDNRVATAMHYGSSARMFCVPSAQNQRLQYPTRTTMMYPNAYSPLPSNHNAMSKAMAIPPTVANKFTYPTSYSYDQHDHTLSRTRSSTTLSSSNTYSKEDKPQLHSAARYHSSANKKYEPQQVIPIKSRHQSSEKSIVPPHDYKIRRPRYENKYTQPGIIIIRKRHYPRKRSNENTARHSHCYCRPNVMSHSYPYPVMCPSSFAPNPPPILCHSSHPQRIIEQVIPPDKIIYEQVLVGYQTEKTLIHPPMQRVCIPTKKFMLVDYGDDDKPCSGKCSIVNAEQVLEMAICDSGNMRIAGDTDGVHLAESLQQPQVELAVSSGNGKTVAFDVNPASKDESLAMIS
ncbi:hypothetical protein GJ496_003017 [Pomphorhynchus laevis]|nr:hypothetical protein GJ496_003017 [Pomphorhynchus laevis]